MVEKETQIRSPWMNETIMTNPQEPEGSAQNPIELLGEGDAEEERLFDSTDDDESDEESGEGSDSDIIEVYSGSKDEDEAELETNLHIGQGGIPKEWILLDNCSTINVFSNPKLLKNIRRAGKTMKIRCQAGTSTTKLIEDLPGYPDPVWFAPKGIANLLSLSKVKKHFRIQYDSEQRDGCFIVQTEKGEVKFRESTEGLYFHDTAKHRTEASFVTTVEDNEQKFTKRQVQQAKLARLIQETTGHHTTEVLMRAVDGNTFRDLPISRSDLLNADTIFGPSVSGLMGRTTRTRPQHVTDEHHHIPRELHQQHQVVTLTADIFYVERLGFIATRSRKIRFSTVEPIPRQDTNSLFKAIRRVKEIYNIGHLRVRRLYGDRQFEPLCGPLVEIGITLNTTAANEHVPEIERYIRTVKEHLRATYKRFPARMLIEGVIGVNF